MHIQKSFQSTTKSGKLYLVATPIGNLEDITFRAVRILQEADWIAAEDTRHTRKLLAYYEITPKQLVSYHEHNKQASGAEIIRVLQAGKSVALVSDAGLPTVSDPGMELVQNAVEAQIPVIPIPGANAALSALIMSGLSTVPFLFAGFLPRDKKKQREQLQMLRRFNGTVIFYEAPHRLRKTLAVIYELWGDQPAAIVRELTKKHEEALRGTLAQCVEWYADREVIGEICVLVEAPGSGDPSAEVANWWESLTVSAHVTAYEEQGLTRKEAMKKAAADRGVSKRDIYQACLQEEKNP